MYHIFISYPGDAGACLWAMHGATELRCLQLWHSAPPGMAVGCCELHLVTVSQTPAGGGGLPVGIWPGTIQVCRSR